MTWTASSGTHASIIHATHDFRVVHKDERGDFCTVAKTDAALVASGGLLRAFSSGRQSWLSRMAGPKWGTGDIQKVCQKWAPKARGFRALAFPARTFVAKPKLGVPSRSCCDRPDLLGTPQIGLATKDRAGSTKDRQALGAHFPPKARMIPAPDVGPPAPHLPKALTPPEGAR